MGTRPIFHAEFGRYLVELRERKGWTNQSDAARHAQKQVPDFSRQKLVQLEQGKTKDLEPELLRNLAQLYDVPYPEMARRFVTERYGVNLAQPADTPAKLAEQLRTMQDSAFQLFEVIRDARALLGSNWSMQERRTGRDRRAARKQE